MFCFEVELQRLNDNSLNFLYFPLYPLFLRLDAKNSGVRLFNLPLTGKI